MKGLHVKGYYDKLILLSTPYFLQFDMPPYMTLHAHNFCEDQNYISTHLIDLHFGTQLLQMPTLGKSEML